MEEELTYEKIINSFYQNNKGDKDRDNIILIDTSYKILLSIGKRKEPKARKVSKDTNISYSHTITRINEFEELGLVKSRKRGRERRIKLTETGERIINNLINIDKTIFDDGT